MARHAHAATRASHDPRRFFADVVIFDPDTIEDRATWTEPTQYPVGIDYVLVNGVVVVERGRHTGARPGRVMRGPGALVDSMEGGV